MKEFILPELVGTHALCLLVKLRLLPCCPCVQLDGLVRKVRDITERDAHSREMIM